MDNPILTLKSVGKRFPGVVALRGVSLEVAKARAMCCSARTARENRRSSTCSPGSLPPTKATSVRWQAYRPKTPTDAYRAGIRVVHQELSMLSQMTVAENLLFEACRSATAW